MTTNEENLAGAAMAALVGQVDEKGESIADRVSVADLWLILSLVIPVIRLNLAEEITKMTLHPGIHVDRRIWISKEVREALGRGQKIVAIKEARAVSGLGLKDAKDHVERMEGIYKSMGGWPR